VDSRRLVGDLTQEHEDDTDDHNLGHEDVAPRGERGDRSADERSRRDGDRTGGGDHAVGGGPPLLGEIRRDERHDGGMMRAAPSPSSSDQPSSSTPRLGASAVVAEPSP